MNIQLHSLLDRLPGKAARLIFVSDDAKPHIKTFEDLFRDTVALKERLNHAGIKPGMRIGLLAPSSYAWMQWDLATTSLDCISVAFTQDSRESVAQLIERYSMNLIAVEPTWVRAEFLEAECVIDINKILPEQKHPRNCPAPALPAGTHSLAFSSGTTGRTKGLIISSAGTEHLIDLYRNAFGTLNEDRFLTFLPFSNYQQRMAYYFCLEHGIDFVYTPYTHLFDSLRQHTPTFTIAPPLFYESLHNIALSLCRGDPDAPEIARCLRDLVGGNIRYLVTGMAPIKRQTIEFFWKYGLPLYEAFGITEAGMVAWNKPGVVKIGTVGKPAESGSVSLTEEGEVIITREALLSLGYFDAPEEDMRATFIGPHSVATGDIAHLDEQGYLVITGRKKDIIVARSGEKFHPEPIEILLQEYSRVKTAVVTSCETKPGTTAILVVASMDDECTSQVRQHIGKINGQLPACQQIRDVICTTQEFSIENGLYTKNLKLNRNAIRAAFLETKVTSAGAM